MQFSLLCGRYIYIYIYAVDIYLQKSRTNSQARGLLEEDLEKEKCNTSPQSRIHGTIFIINFTTNTMPALLYGQVIATVKLM